MPEISSDFLALVRRILVTKIVRNLNGDVLEQLAHDKQRFPYVFILGIGFRDTGDPRQLL